MKPTLFHHRAGGFNLLELLVVIAVVLALIGGFFLLYRLSRVKNSANRTNCVNNLKQVGLSFHLWAGDNNNKFPMQVSVANGGAMELAHSGNVFPIFQVMSNELSTPKIMVCPSDTNRVAATNFTTDFDNSKVSYFVGLDAIETNATMLLAGDRNLTTNGVPVGSGLVTFTTKSRAGWTSQLHRGNGDVGLADGSVQQVTDSRLQNLIANTGVTTNRLVLP